MSAFPAAEYVIPRFLADRRHAVIYTSISSPAGSGLQRQLDCCRNFAEQAGLVVQAAFEDTALRETAPEQRPGLCDALSALRAVSDGVLIAENLDRLAISQEEVSVIRSWITEAGAVLVSTEEHRIGSPTEEFRADVARAIQEYRTALVNEVIEKSILIAPQTRERLQERAVQEGRDLHELADALLASALADAE